MAAAQHAGDVQLQVENGKIVLGIAQLDSGDSTTSVIIGERVFSDALLTNFRSSDPGFNSDATGNPVLPAGIEGFPGGTSLMFDLLPIEVGPVTANFFYWDGLDQGSDGVGPEDVDFTLAPAGVTWTLVDDGFTFYTADGSPDMVTGGLLGQTSPSGRLHNHLPIAVDDSDGNILTTADEGIYLASIQARSVGFETSDPFFFVHRSPTISESVLDIASTWVDDHYDALVGAAPLPGDANGDGNVDLLDLDILGANFGLMGGATFEQGDFNGDGNVDLLDLDILGGNFGTTASASIPEPTAWVALGSLALGMGVRRGPRGATAG